MTEHVLYFTVYGKTRAEIMAAATEKAGAYFGEPPDFDLDIKTNEITTMAGGLYMYEADVTARRKLR